MTRNANDDVTANIPSYSSHQVEIKRPSPSGEEVPVSKAGRQKILSALQLFAAPEDNATPPPAASVDALSGCFLPKFIQNERVWGVALQLYELKSARNWGIGDFADLCSFIDLAAKWGADFVGLNPLHAPFIAAAGRCSPYEPSNRRFLNPLYIAVDGVDGFESTEELQRDINQLRREELVDYENVARIKRKALHHAWLKARDRADPSFLDFCREGGKDLRLHALFEAISEAQVAAGREAGWKSWPENYRDPGNEAVRQFEKANADQVSFHLWLQWTAHLQLAETSERAMSAGMRIGLYLDVAVGEAPDGSATWSNRDCYVQGASIGSPPDPMAVDGQDWRLAALHPSAIVSGHPSPFEATMSGVMRYAGAIRIDHVAALRRLFLVPDGESPHEGAYVRYPQQALMSSLASLSKQYDCLVIGEDLGNLPKGLQVELAAANILSYRILSYEQDKSGFTPPQHYPVLALACVSTHDHQTFPGWWQAADVTMRKDNRLIPDEAARRQVKDRKGEKHKILAAFKGAGLLGAKATDQPGQKGLAGLAVAAHAYVARTPSLLMAVRLADLTNEKQPTNVPGTKDGYPNWRPKLSLMLEELNASADLHAIIDAVKGERANRAGTTIPTARVER